MTSSLRTAICIAVAGLGMVAGPAGATAPGENGSIVFRRFLGPDATRGTLFVVEPDGSGTRLLAAPPTGTGYDYPDFAADGSVVVFESCAGFCRIMAVDRDGSGLRTVGPGCAKGQMPPACSDNNYPALSPDGRSIAFQRAEGPIRHDTIQHARIYVMAADGSHARRITNPPPFGTEDGQVQWSPDGRRLVFTRKVYDGDGVARQAVYVVGADGRGLRRVTPWRLRAGDGPDFSPDGRRILFRSPETENFYGSQLYTIHTDGSGLTQVTHLARTTKLFSASFSPDGQRITFGRQGVGGQADVFTMAVDGSDVQQLTHTPQRDSAPDWGGRPPAR